jgi:hypothetical protein
VLVLAILEVQYAMKNSMVVWLMSDVRTEKGLMISGQKALEIYLLIPCKTVEADATLHACVPLKPQGVSTPVYFYPNFRSFIAFSLTARF